MRCQGTPIFLWLHFFRKLRKLLYAFTMFTGFLFCRTELQAQEEFIPPPSQYITSFPFRLLTGGTVLVKAQLAGLSDSLSFIFDTGSGGISLDSMTCLRLNILTYASDKTIRGIAGIRKVKFIYNQTLRLPGLFVDSLNFHINDYDILTSVYGEKIDGIIGYSFFARYILKIDYDSLKIYVYSKGSLKYPKGGYLLRPIIAGLPIQSARVKDEADILTRFYFDTGAGLCLLLSSDFVSDSALMRSKKKEPVLTQAEGLGGKAAMKLSTVKEFRLGPYHFHNVPAYIFDDEYNVTSYPSLGGLIGNDILRRFNIILNYDRREIHLTPNTHYRDLFDYSYTGLNIYWVDGQIVVSDIMKNSPAEKAGFKEGDIVVAVNKDFSKNIQTYKNLLQSPGEKVQVIVQRDKELIELLLKVKSIL
jgi:PDZ domain-containing protein/aspartyl protease